MGTLFLRGNRYGISYIDPNGKQVRRMISEYKETAQRVLRKIETDIVENRYLDRKKVDSVLFEDFLEEFLTNYVYLENRRPKNREGLIRKIAKSFRGKYLQEIDTRMIRQYLAKKLEESKPATVNRHLTILRCFFNRAIDWKILDGENPTYGIKKLPEDNERCRWLTNREQAFLLSHCHGITRIIVVAALQTGLRWNEIMNLKWSQSPKSNYVDFDNNVIVVHSTLSKSRKPRFIPLSAYLRCEFEVLKKTAQGEYIFANPKTLKPFNNIRRSFLRAVNSSGLQGLKFHDLRHVFATNLVHKGVDLYVVQQLLGHSSPKMTQRYAHIRPDHFKTAIEEIDLQNTELGYNLASNSTDLAQLLEAKS